MSDVFEVNNPDPDPTKTLTNVERLQSHLAIDGLAMALLSVWNAGDLPDVQTRMFEVLNKFGYQGPAGVYDSSPN